MNRKRDMPKEAREFLGYETEKQYEDAHDLAVDRAHETLDFIMQRYDALKKRGEITTADMPGMVLMEVAHILSNLLLAAPRKELIPAAMEFFRRDLDVEGLIEFYDDQGYGDEDIEEEEDEERVLH